MATLELRVIELYKNTNVKERFHKFIKSYFDDDTSLFSVIEIGDYLIQDNDRSYILKVNKDLQYLASRNGIELSSVINNIQESKNMNIEQRLSLLEKTIGIKEYNSSEDELIDPKLVKRIRNWYIGRMKKFDKGELPRPSEREFKNKFELNDWEIDQLVDEFGFILT